MLINIKLRITNLLPKNDFAKGVGVLVGGTVGAQILMILASPVLTRLYTPEDFGLLAVYASILSLFTVIASLRYELAIPLPENDTEAIHLALLSLVVICFTTILSAFLVFFAGEYIANSVNEPRLANYLWLLPIGIFTIGAYQVFNYWALRKKSFTVIAKTKIWQSLTGLILQLSLFKLNALALILGQVGSQAIGVSSLAKTAIKDPGFRKWKWSDLKKVAIRYKKFPLFSTWGGFVNTAGLQLPPLLFAMFFSAGAAGLYALAHRVLAMPMSLIGAAVGNVFFSNAAEAHREDKLAMLFEQVYVKLVSLIMPVALILIIDAPRFFSFIFGEEWQGAGELARWMAPWLAVVFIASPLSVLFEVLEKQKQGMFFQTIMLTSRIIGIYIGYLYQDMTLAIILFSFFSMGCWIGFLIWIIKKTKNKISYLLIELLKYLIISFLCVIPLIIASLYSESNSVWLMGAIPSFIIILLYYIIVLKKMYLN